MGDRVEEGLYLSWMGGPDLDYWREDLMERFVLDGASEESIEDLEGMTNDEFLHAHSEWYNEDARFEWECMVDNLTELIKEFSGYWHAEVSNFGWQARTGQQDFTAEDGRDFLRKLLPDCECHFKIYRDKRLGSSEDWADGVARDTTGLTIQNFHHDSPMGGEWYYLTDVGTTTACSECRKRFPSKDYYESEDLGCALMDHDMCQACGKKYYEEDDDAKSD